MWKHYVDKYSVSDEGQIKNEITGRILKLRPSHRGYLKTNISINGKIRTIFIHQIVAQLFIPNPNNLPQVNHIDGDKTHNNKENIEWVTEKENMRHAIKNNLYKNGKSKKVGQYTLDGNLVKIFNSESDAAKEVYGNIKLNPKISMCVTGKIKSYKNFIWKSID